MDTQQLMRQGVETFSKGDYRAALQCFDQVLEREPGNVQALNNRGGALLQLGRPEEALEYLTRVLALQPGQVEALCNCGHALNSLGFHAEALTCLDKALQARPRHVGALNNRGLALQGLERHEEALACFEQALAAQPGHLEALVNHGASLLALRREQAALECFEGVLALHPGHGGAMNNRGLALQNLRRYEEALQCFDWVLERTPDQAEALGNRGLALLRLRRESEALDCFERALRLDPEHPDALNNKGVALHALDRDAEALECFDGALALAPDDTEALGNRGLSLVGLQRYPEALECFDRLLESGSDRAAALRKRSMALLALKRYAEARQDLEEAQRLRPDDAETLNSLGSLLDRLNLRHEALACLEQACELDPAYLEARMNRGVVLLSLGELAAGWEGIETRWELHPLKATRLRSAAPQWRGEAPLPGKTLLLLHEQGLGDTLQFVRYASLAAQRGTRVVLRVPKVLHRLLRGLDGVAEIVDSAAPLPPHDLYCPMMSVPLAFGTTLPTVPARTPYLTAEPELAAAWAERLGPRRRPRIGVVWAGRQYHPIDPRRDVPLAMLRPIFALDADFISLQKDIPEGDRMVIERLPLLRHGETLGDYADTAGLIENLDLVIAADTSVAHLAGAMNKPTWLMNRHASCWRWLQERGDSPWYPSLRIFRQQALDQWENVVEEIRAALAHGIEAERMALARSDAATEVLLNEGLAELQGGAPEAALRSFERILKADADHLDGLRHCGLALVQLGRFAEALDCFDRVVARAPDDERTQHNRAIALTQLNRADDAIAAFEQVLRRQPRQLDVLVQLGGLLAIQGLFERALLRLDQALELAPDHAGALAVRGYALLCLGRHAEALPSLDRAIERVPGHVEALVNRGFALMSLGRYGEALDSLDRALVEMPDHLHALDNRGAVLDKLGRKEDAVRCFDRALAIAPADPGVLLNRAIALSELERHDEALADLKTVLAANPQHFRALKLHGFSLLRLNRAREALQSLDCALAIDPRSAEAYIHRGVALADLERHEEALSNVDRALELGLDRVDGLRHRGVVLDRLRRRAEAVAAFSQVLEEDPGCSVARANRGLALLALGDYPRGFRDQEARWENQPLKRHKLDTAATLWLGETPLDGRTILLHAEQGFGDTIQFARYAPRVARLGARVILRVPDGLAQLMRSLDGVAQLITERAPLPAHDCHCPLLSLPLALGTTVATIPADVPYLAAEAPRTASWSLRLGPKRRPRVGLVWAGRQYPPVNFRRDMSLELVQPLLQLDAEFICLQKEIPDHDQAALERLPQLQRLGESCTDFADTAALIENLDLVITVDTSVAHLAGALNKPVWIMNRYASCWRWLEDREDSPWYPSARLFRQSSLGDWPGLVEQVRAALAAWIDAAEAPGAGPASDALRQPGPRPAAAAVDELIQQGLARLQRDQPEQAEPLFRQALDLAPRHQAALRCLGFTLINLGRHEEARRCFEEGLAQAPDDVGLLHGLGVALGGLARDAEALASLDHALELAPQHVNALSNRAIALRNLGRGEESLACTERALAIDPRHVSALVSRGSTLEVLNRHEEALACFDQALAIAPGHHEAIFCRGRSRLALGRLAEGFRDFESRWEGQLKHARLNTPAPQWRGLEPVSGATILLHAEQGLGDTIQFVRYAPLLAQRGARVVLRVPGPLLELMRSLPAGLELLADDEPLPAHDFHCPLLSLPLAFGTTLETIPASIPYLHAAPAGVAQWSGRLGRQSLPRIGLAWAGRQHGRINVPRDMPLESLLPLLEIGADFISLQKEVPGRDLAVLERLPGLRRLGEELGDFADTAALVQNLDLVIAVDSAVAHLAAALGKPVWLLNRHGACWRWLRDRGDSPWYPTLRQFRQRSPCNWAGVVQDVKAALARLVPPVASPKPGSKPPSSSAAMDFNGRGILHGQEGRYAEALACFDQALQADPDYADALFNRGAALGGLERLDEAFACFDGLLRRHPGRVDALRSRAVVHGKLHRFAEALADFDRALGLEPDHVDTLAGCAIALFNLGRHDEAMSAIELAARLAPDDPDVRIKRASILLSAGRLAEGFRDYESRWLSTQFKDYRPESSAPLWLGETEPEGRTILLYTEQGLGDTLQFARYAPLLAGAGARVLLRVPNALRGLMQSLPGAIRVIGDSEPFPPHEMRCPLMSLPLAFETELDSIPAQVPYLAAAPARVAKWAERLGRKRRPRVGLVWAGRQYAPINRARDIGLHVLLPLFELDADFISLQKELPQVDLELAGRLPGLSRVGETLGDFADTAALIENLDLVISVDTSVVHLAGALGKPVWIMNRYASCWRWLRERPDSPWYPTARLFRQPALGDWGTVVEEVRATLAEWIGGVRDLPCDGGATAPAAAAKELRDGLAALDREEYQAAAASFTALLQRDPDHAEALCGLGTALNAMGAFEQALPCLDQALTLAPAHAEARQGLGVALGGLGDAESALACFDSLLSLHPDHARASRNRAHALARLERHAEALAGFESALELEPGHVGAILGQGSALANLQRFEEALPCFQQAAQLQPGADALGRLGFVLGKLGRYEEALDCLDRALALEPSHVDALYRRSDVLHRLDRLDEALRDLEQVLALDPGHADARCDRGMIKLALGDLHEGFRDFESRWHGDTLRHARLQTSAPLWLGDVPLRDRTILLHAEQGLGDTIQFARYAPLVAALGGRVILRVPAAMKELMLSLRGPQRVVDDGEELPPHDCHCPLLSLPLAFNTSLASIPADVPYLSADPLCTAAWSARLGHKRRLRIGLAWAGRQYAPVNRARDMSLDLLLPLFGLDAEFISLQKELPRADQELAGRLPQLSRLGETLKDFADTAALVQNLDLVITVDTAVAHLAGAMGKPVWIMNRYASCWRWLRGRADSPWYPGARLFRQKALGDWEPVVREVKAAVESWLRIQATEAPAAPRASEDATASRQAAYA